MSDLYIDPASEFKRIGVPSSKWRITHINDDYRLCSTYPSLLAVPHEISDETIGKLSSCFFTITSCNVDVYTFSDQLGLPAFARKVAFPRCVG